MWTPRVQREAVLDEFVRSGMEGEMLVHQHTAILIAPPPGQASSPRMSCIAIWSNIS